MRGGAVTITLNPQDAVCRFASTALHATTVAPIGKLNPLGGVHVVVIGAVPPAAVGHAYVTAIESPLADAMVCAAGQISTIAGGIAGAVGPSPQRTAPIALTITAARRRLERGKRGTLQESRYGSMQTE